MNYSPKNDLPWELIAESLTGSLSAEQELQLQQWISSGAENQEKYLQIKELWKTGMEDYRFYQVADEEESWKALHAKIRKDFPEQTGTSVIQVQFNQGQKFIRNLITIAAVFIGFVGIGLWFVLQGNHPVMYETALNEQKKITLPDGSVITLQSSTKIEVPAGFNKSGRTIIMDAGEALFDVVHNPGKSFIVELGSTQIKDIGTSFTIHREINSIDVSVSTGKIAFVKLSTRETRELNAGSAITFDLKSESFGNMRTGDPMKIMEQMLDFENAPLSEVIVSIQKVYGKKITLTDDIANKTFTGELYGMPYKNALKVICESLGLEYSLNDSIYLLKTKTIEQP
jgi:ferric-dicitrate binding protein FerR (iron transport regulator)